MIKRLLIYIAICLGILICLAFVFINIDNNNFNGQFPVNENYNNNLNIPAEPTANLNNISAAQNINLPSQTESEDLTLVKLAVPYINEAPDDIWTGPWKNACEEASISMIENYYHGKSSATISDAKDFMNMLFTKENEIWGSNADTDALRTARLINDYTVANATIITDPTIEQIKTELQQKRPVISLHYGFDLQNPNIPFVPAPRGSSYHVMVIIGYDDETQEFITNDTGDRKDGPGHRYNYDLFMNTLHDFNFAVRQANGPATVIFTYPKLVKTIDSAQVYYLTAQTKQAIADEKTFEAKGWTWDAVNVVEKTWLDSFSDGPVIQ